MGEKTPDTDESGIERRNVLKGLGFGAVSAVGAGVFVGNVEATTFGSPLNAGITPPGEDLDDDEINPPGVPSLGSGAFDLVVSLPMSNQVSGDKNVVAKHLSIVRVGQGSGSPPTIVEGFEEGTARASVEKLKINSNGVVKVRERFNVDGLPSGDYALILSLQDYTPISGLSTLPGPRFGGTLKGSDKLTSQSGVNRSDLSYVIAHRFNKP